MLIFGTLPKICFRRRENVVSVRAEDSDIQVSEVRRTIPQPDSRERTKMAADAGIEIEFIRKRNFRKEDRVKEILAGRGEQPRLVCIVFSRPTQLGKLGIDYRTADNALSHIADWQRAQRISNGWEAKRIHARLDEFARHCCPIYRDFARGYHWSVDQCEYATDIVYH
ncbi:MAG: hypothetical protein M3Z36_10715 [Acidobacteriota bacterium]|nr:hypothetical protein [Acidobacteriota bacterium]